MKRKIIFIFLILFIISSSILLLGIKQLNKKKVQQKEDLIIQKEENKTDTSNKKDDINNQGESEDNNIQENKLLENEHYNESQNKENNSQQKDEITTSDNNNNNNSNSNNNKNDDTVQNPSPSPGNDSKESVDEDSVDTNDIFYNLHKGRIDFKTVSECHNYGYNISFKYIEIASFTCTDVMSVKRNVLGQYIYYYFRTSEFDSYDSCIARANLIKNDLKDKITSFSCDLDNNKYILHIQ